MKSLFILISKDNRLNLWNSQYFTFSDVQKNDIFMRLTMLSVSNIEVITMPRDFCNAMYWHFFLASNVDTHLQINDCSHPDSFGRNNTFSCQFRERRGSGRQKGWDRHFTIYQIWVMISQFVLWKALVILNLSITLYSLQSIFSFIIWFNSQNLRER